MFVKGVVPKGYEGVDSGWGVVGRGGVLRKRVS